MFGDYRLSTARRVTLAPQGSRNLAALQYIRREYPRYPGMPASLPLQIFLDLPIEWQMQHAVSGNPVSLLIKLFQKS